jgi:hypothetical protein
MAPGSTARRGTHAAHRRSAACLLVRRAEPGRDYGRRFTRPHRPRPQCRPRPRRVQHPAARLRRLLCRRLGLPAVIFDLDRTISRQDVLARAIRLLKAHNAIVYLDAGHPGWIAAAEMADRLRASGVARADGFSLNVSNFASVEDRAYGDDLSRLLGGKHYVIDTSRNGRGSNGGWCNPGRTSRSLERYDAARRLRRRSTPNGRTCSVSPMTRVTAPSTCARSPRTLRVIVTAAAAPG